MMRLMKTMCGLLTAMLLLTSCLKSDDDSKSSLSNDTAIIAFSVGDMNKYTYSTSSTGETVATKTTVKGSDYVFSIDENNHHIFNADSLPVGTDVKHVVCSVSSLNNGVVLIKSLASDSLFYFTASDSLDFSRPREFFVYASDGTGPKSYTVQLNVHQEEGEQFCWIQHANSEEIASLEAMKAVMLNKSIYVYGTKGGKTVGYKTVDGKTWTPLTEINDKDAYQNMVVMQDDAIYMIADGSLQKTTDGITWKVITNDVDVKRLIAASYTELYAYNDKNKIMFSFDKGETWIEDEWDEDFSWLPTEELAYVCVPLRMTAYADYILLAGISPAIGSVASVWRKIVEYDLQGLLEDKWVYMERTDDNLLGLPQLKNLILLAYDDGVLAFGEEDNKFSPIYQSRDNGITWKKNTRYRLPDQFKGNVASFAATTDGKEIWLVSGGTGEVWQGHLNRLAWEEQE